MNPLQHGFVGGKSYPAQLVEVYDNYGQYKIIQFYTDWYVILA